VHNDNTTHERYRHPDGQADAFTMAQRKSAKQQKATQQVVKAIMQWHLHCDNSTSTNAAEPTTASCQCGNEAWLSGD